jgi:type I restriction enzyme S subunit
MSATATPEQVRRFSLRAGDVLITKDSESWTDIAVSALVISDLPGVLCGYHLALVRPEDKDSAGFLARGFSAIGPRDQFQIAANGITRYGLGGSAISTSIFGMPPIREQRGIATYLDRETTKIDALIENKERLIELLQEKRTALITRAVTKGLDPTVPMKDSGVDWLGEVPAHWEVAPLCQCLLMYTYGFTNPMPVAELGPYMLTALDVGDGKVLYENARHTTDDAYKNLLTDKSRPKKGDVLLTKDGTLGRTAIVDEARVCINQSVALLRFNPKLMDVDFVQNALRSAIYQSRMIFEAGGTAIKHIYISRLAKMPIAVPSMSEQVLISRYLGISTNRIDILMDKIQTVIIHLREYRTALISAAVTGKIDIRGE